MKPETLRFSSLRIFGFLIAATALLVACGGGGGSSMNAPGNTMAQPLATQMLKGSMGFVNAAGFTVYVFDADLATPGHSACNGACAGTWPPVAPPTLNLPAPWSTITRSDNSMQLTYNGRPLYTFSGDAHAGDTNGDGLNVFGGLWHIARPLASGASPGPSPTMMPSGY
jgi:predicted lipoprotein with Yx(FWY)xxD motif